MIPVREMGVGTLVGRLRRLGLEEIARAITRVHYVDLEVVLSRDRHAHVSLARKHLAAVLYWSADLNFPAVGELLGMHHTSVIDCVREWGRVLENAHGMPGEWSRLSKAKREPSELALAVVS